MDYKTKKGDTVRGPATVKLLKNSIQIRMSDDEVEGGSYTPGRVYEVARSDAPAIVLAGEMWVALNGKGTILYSVGPIEGDFLFRFKEWRGKPGETPEPRFDAGGRVIANKETGQKFTTRASFSMDAVCQIVEGKFEGATALYMQPYAYVADDESGNAMVELGAKQLEKLKVWDKAVGLDDAEVAYEKNLLPAFAKIILKKARVFQGHVSGGMIRSVSLPPDGYKPRSTKTAAKGKK